MKRKVKIYAIVLLFFNSASAMFGGLGLIIDPSGETMQMPIEFLKNSPFENFLIPGIILFTVNGIFNLLVGINGIKKKQIFPILTILCGLFLVIWLSVQIMIIKDFYAPLHAPYYSVGIALIILGLILRRQLKSE